MARCRNNRAKEAMAVVGERCCRSPTAQADGGKQALATRMGEAKRIIRILACEHKVGMCKCPYDGFMLYQDVESS